MHLFHGQHCPVCRIISAFIIPYLDLRARFIAFFFSAYKKRDNASNKQKATTDIKHRYDLQRNCQHTSQPGSEQKKEGENGAICTENASAQTFLSSDLDQRLGADLPANGWRARQDKNEEDQKERPTIENKQVSQPFSEQTAPDNADRRYFLGKQPHQETTNEAPHAQRRQHFTILGRAKMQYCCRKYDKQRVNHAISQGSYSDDEKKCS